MKITGDALRIERGRRGLTQQQLGDVLGVSLRTVQLWEKGNPVPMTRYAGIHEALGTLELGAAAANGLDAYSEIDLLTELIRRSATRLQPPSDQPSTRSQPPSDQPSGRLTPTQKAARILVTAMARSNSMTPREAAEAAKVAGGPSVDELEARIIAYRADVRLNR